MPVVGKEIERPLTPEETAQQVEQVGYVERVEKQAETRQPVSAVPSQPQIQDTQEGDMGKIVSEQFAVQTKPKIILPLTQREIEESGHHSIKEAISWAKEWCIMMIKKYPGRVFYLPPETR